MTSRDLPKAVRKELNRRHKISEEFRENFGLPPEDHYAIMQAIYSGSKNGSGRSSDEAQPLEVGSVWMARRGGQRKVKGKVIQVNRSKEKVIITSVTGHNVRVNVFGKPPTEGNQLELKIMEFITIYTPSNVSINESIESLSEISEGLHKK